ANAARRADPQIAFAVFRERLKAVVSQAFVSGESRSLPVRETYHSVVVCAEPHGAGAILKYPTKTQTADGVREVEGLHASVRETKHFACDGGEPENSMTIGIDGGNVVVRKAVLNTKNLQIGGAHPD